MPSSKNSKHLSLVSSDRFHQLPEEKRGTRICGICGAEFVPKTGVHRFCSPICKNKENQINGSMTVAKQYLRISGNWERYFNRLQKHKREEITTEVLLKKLKEQNYKCALSGVQLTCLLEQSKKFKTNASIDRIKAGFPYTEDNIQLVCAALNSWRGDTPIDEFVWFCKQVTLFHEEKE